jgi:hypothetical protein
VPKALLRPWLQDHNNQSLLNAYFWQPQQKKLLLKRRGLDAVCNQLDLLSLQQHQLGRDALEKIFFGGIDQNGVRARNIMIERGVDALSKEDRIHFSAFLLSLDARRPKAVEQIRAFKEKYVEMLNSDPDIARVMKEVGEDLKPSEYYESRFGLLADRAMLLIQSSVMNSKVGPVLANASWKLFRMQDGDETLVLSDRPLIRLHGYEDPRALWILPLSPSLLFVAANNSNAFQEIAKLTTNRIVKNANVLSASQVERYVFVTNHSHSKWLADYLRPQEG